MFAYRTHERLSKDTTLSFRPTLAGQPVGFDSTILLDGKPIESGQRIPIGWHKVTLSHPKTKSFSTNLFVWYGVHNLGEIPLERSKGVLVITAQPPAHELTIRGPEFVLMLTNSSGTNLSVPTDNYFVEAKYSYWQKQEEVSVSDLVPQNVRFAPRFGSLQTECNVSEASFELTTVDDRLIEASKFPSTTTELPEGKYKLVAKHHGHEREQVTEVKEGRTNDLKVEFLYGTAFFETTPSGATVWNSNNQNLGETPLNLAELEPGLWKFELKREGYEPVLTILEIVQNQTNTFRTNLVSTTYLGSIAAARQFLAAAEYTRAYEAAVEALKITPDDPIAGSLKRQAFGSENLRLAEELGKQGNYTGGIKRLELAIDALPDSGHAKQLLADFKKREPEQIERERQARLNRGKRVFDSLLRRYSDAALFEVHEIKTSMPVKEVGAAIVNELKTQPPFELKRYMSTVPETFEIEATQGLMTVLATTAGRRQCVIVGAQVTDDETQILFKILEYKAEAVYKFSIGNWIGAPGAVNLVPIHASATGALSEKLQAQIKEGVRTVTERVERAIGQSSGEKNSGNQ